MAAVGAGELLLGREKLLMIEMFKIGNKVVIHCKRKDCQYIQFFGNWVYLIFECGNYLTVK
jgi:hypothetical protein